jgi:nucleoside-diphosphate-sugar epimerase
MKKILVCGAGGFIGYHLVRDLKNQGYYVIGADIKRPLYALTDADEFYVYDLRNPELVEKLITSDIAEIYQLAADMGGTGYIGIGNHDSDIMHNSAMINLNVAEWAVKHKVKRVFYSSSACMYPEHNQLDPTNPNCEESSAYPANPDSEYGWEKLFSERLFLAFNRNYNLDVRIARFHNIFGPQGTWKGGKEKAPAAMCRKAAETPDGGEIEVWGDGLQTRSFLYIDECVDAVLRLMRQEQFLGPVNIGSEEMVTINKLAELAIAASGKNITIKNIGGEEFEAKYGFKCPTGVRGRNSDNTLYKEKIGSDVYYPLDKGVQQTFQWINKQING